MEENYLLAKWLNNDLSATELAEFEASPEYATYQKIKTHSAHLEVGAFDGDQLLNKVLKQQKPAPKVVALFPKWLFRIAALFVLSLGIAYTMYHFVSQTTTAGYGETATLELPDHSKVVLNSGSTIAYKKWQWDTHRNLKLQGEAYFRVAKGKRFEVATSLGKVTVLGTQFNVKARENRFDVTCFEGRVKVNYKDQQILLTHGQSVTFENGIANNSITTESSPDWLQQEIAFHAEKLQRVIAEIERHYNVTITLKNVHTTALFTGKIPTKTLDVAIQIIAKTYNLKMSKVAPNKIIFEGK